MKRKRKPIFLLLLMGVMGCSVLAGLYFKDIHEQRIAEIQRTGTETLQEAIDHIARKEYTDALNLLNDIPSEFSPEQMYKRTISEMKIYLHVLLTYDSTDIDSLQEALRELEYIDGRSFSSILPDTFGDEVNAFKGELLEKCNNLMRTEYEGIIPYVGMGESSLKHTQWGVPIKEVTRKSSTAVHKYYFYKIDTVVCLAYISHWQHEISASVSGVYVVYKKTNGKLKYVPIDSESTSLLSDSYVDDQIAEYIE